MKIELLMSAAAEGKLALAAFQNEAPWTGVSHTGKATDFVGQFGADLRGEGGTPVQIATEADIPDVAEVEYLIRVTELNSTGVAVGKLLAEFDSRTMGAKSDEAAAKLGPIGSMILAAIIRRLLEEAKKRLPDFFG